MHIMSGPVDHQVYTKKDKMAVPRQSGHSQVLVLLVALSSLY